jgi:glycosyltransferase involved in cell wall biosynthesis
MAERWQPDLVSVVIPTYNRTDVLPRVLAAFETQTLPADRFEVLVVDDGSNDGTPERVAAYQATCPYRLTLLQQTNQGPAAARNAGLAQARGDIVVFIDDDCIAETRLLEEHVASHDVAGLAVIGVIDWHPDLPQTPFMRFVREHTFSYFFITLPYDAPFACFYTGNASVHRATALAVGGFDQDFPRAMHEDIEFGYRLRRQGVRFVFNDRARVLHYRASDLGSALERERLNGRELVRLWAKHPELAALVPIDQMVDPEVQQQFYLVATTYYQRLGIQDALGTIQQYDPSETLPDRFREEYRHLAGERAEMLHAELNNVHHLRRQDLATLERERQWAAHLFQEHERLQAAYEEQAAWAADLARRLDEQRSARPLPDLLRRLARLPGTLLGRRGLRPAPPAPTPHADA